jgi:hypothetical protein
VRFLFASVVAGTLGLSAWSIWHRDWENLLGVWVVVAGALAFLCLYAAAVWLTGHSVRGVWRVLRRRFPNARARA